MELAPIIIFAFNRPDALSNTIQSLLNNPESVDSEIYFFVDGPREKKGEKEKVSKVHELVKAVKGFKSVHYFFSSENKGLGPSIIEGVTKIINQYGKAIVLEDDLVFAPNFLSFINQGLNLYEENKKIFSICGYSNKVNIPADYKYDAYFCTRSSSWGWGTWADRWNSVDWKLENWDDLKQHKSAFNRWGGSDCFGMLQGWKEGKNKSWAIRFCFAQYLQNKLSLFPLISKVQNDGFDGNGTNCKKWSRFQYEFDSKHSMIFNFPQKVFVNKQLLESALSYHTILIRIWSKLMYYIYS